MFFAIFVVHRIEKRLATGTAKLFQETLESPNDRPTDNPIQNHRTTKSTKLTKENMNIFLRVLLDLRGSPH